MVRAVIVDNDNDFYGWDCQNCDYAENPYFD